jgi:predicted cobalt transporter CbtA
VLLIVGFPLSDVLEGIVAIGSEAIVFGILWGFAGYALLSLRGTVAEQSLRVG